MLSAIGASTIGKFLEDNPSSAAFVGIPKSSYESFEPEKIYSINVFKFVSKDSKETYFHHRIAPSAGLSILSPSDLTSKSSTFLFEELVEQFAKGIIEFNLVAQIGKKGNVIEDATNHWLEIRKQVEFGTVERNLSRLEAKINQKPIIYHPILRVDGVEPSPDPLLDHRAAVHLMSGKGKKTASKRSPATVT